MAELKLGTTIGGYVAWHEGNDGSGSGLDADTLDGQHASAFLQASGAAYYSAAGSYGPQIYASSSSAPGGWARSMNFASHPAATVFGSFGVLGSSSSIDYVYLGAGTDATNYNTAPYLRLYNSGGGYTQASGSMRAPIFYDTDDTGRYADPAGLSSFNKLTVDTTSAGPILNVIQRGLGYSVGEANAALILKTENTTSSQPLFTVQDSSGATNATLYSNGVWYVPIIYDKNDTNWYIDPSSFTSLYRTSAYTAPRDNNADWATAFRNTPAHSYAWHGDYGSGGPRGTWWFYESMRHHNDAGYWGTQVAWGWEDNANELWQRNIQNNNFSGWVRYVNTGNFHSAGMFGHRGVLATDGWNDASTGMWQSNGQTGETGGPGGYSYGGLLSFRASDYGNQHRLQIYAAHTGELKYRTGWNDWSHGWYHIWTSQDFTNPLYENTWINSKYFATDGTIYGTSFRDSNDGGYYCDPASTSNLNGLTVINQITGSVSGYSKYITFDDGPRDLSNRLPNSFTRAVLFDFVGSSTVGGTGNYGGVMTFAPWSGTTASTGDSSYQLGFANASGVNAGGMPKLILRNGIDTTWNSWYTLWHSGYLSVTNSGNPVNPDNVGINHVGYNNSVSLFSQTDGGLYAAAHSSSWVHQIFGDFRTGQIAVRGKNSGTWQAWRTVLDSSNYSSYNSFSGGLNSPYIGINNNTSNNGYGISLYGGASSGAPTYGLMFQGTSTFGTHGAVTGDWATYFNMSATDNRGWIFRRADGTRYASISTLGEARFDGVVRAPGFYHHNDSAYYIDPDGASNINQLMISQLSIGGTAHTSNVRFRNEYTFSSPNASQYGVYNRIIQAPGIALSADRTLHGGYFEAQVELQNAAAYTQTAYGVYGVSELASTGGNTLNGEGTYVGVRGDAYVACDDATYYRAENAMGVYGYAVSSGTTAFTDHVIAINARTSTAGDALGTPTLVAGTLYGVRISVEAPTANRNASTAYGIYMLDNTLTGSITTKYASFFGPNWPSFHKGGFKFGGTANSGLAEGTVQISTLTGTTNHTVYADANGVLTNSSSDARLKTNVVNSVYGLQEVLQMRPVKYNWIDTNRGTATELGFIAQEMQELVPEVIGVNHDDTLYLEYSKLVAVLTRAIQEQQQIINQQEARLVALEQKLLAK